jgi:hypothetical protein
MGHQLAVGLHSALLARPAYCALNGFAASGPSLRLCAYQPGTITGALKVAPSLGSVLQGNCAIGLTGLLTGTWLTSPSMI